MGIFDRFMQKNEDEGVIIPSDSLLSAILNDGEVLNRDQIMNIPQVAANVDIISSIFATIPFRLYKKATDKDGNVKVIKLDDDERVKLINDNTGDTMDPYMLKKAMCEDYFVGLNGGGYAYIEKRRNTVTALKYVKSEDVAVFDLYDDPMNRDYKIAVNAKRYESYEFLKLLRNSRNGVTGESIVEEVNTALKISYQAMKYQYGILKKGGSKKGFLQTNHTLDKDGLASLRENWRRLYSNDNERAVVLNNGLEFKETSSSTAEMQMDETKQTLNREIDSIFHVSDDQEKLIRRAVLPIGTAFEAALNSTLLLEKEKADHYWEADYSELLRASMKERYEAYGKAKKDGWLTINEIRKAENYEAIDGMNVLDLGLAAVLYSVDGEEIDRDRFYVANTDTAERREAENDSPESGKGENPNE